MRILLLIFALSVTGAVADPTPEHVIMCGGPALRKWENLRIKGERHDNWWANFIRASTLRMDEITRAYGKNSKIVWIVYRPGYIARGKEDSKPYTTWIQDVATKRGITLVWADSGPGAIRSLNDRPTRAVATFDYFGHSNRHCFMLDYGSEIMAVCKAWVHEDDLGKIRRGIFAPAALCQSYGCHTGESMSTVWKRKVGNTLIGAQGKTDYAVISQGRLPSVSGRWVR